MITELLRDRHPVFSILGRSEARSFSTPAASGEWLSGAFLRVASGAVVQQSGKSELAQYGVRIPGDPPQEFCVLALLSLVAQLVERPSTDGRCRLDTCRASFSHNGGGARTIPSERGNA
jgi:hypothetical protein